MKVANDKYMAVRVHFIGEDKGTTFGEDEFGRSQIEELVEWFEMDKAEIFKVGFNNCAFTYISRKAIKYIEVTFRGKIIKS